MQPSEAVLTKLSETGNSTREAENKIVSFANDVICMDEEVPAVSDRKMVEFKDTLSSTPSGYQIIEALDMHLMHEEDSYSYRDSDEEPEENTYPMTTKEDAGKPMSPLSEVSINSPPPQHFKF